jgi:deoxycytidine triphosphate deaminase
MSVLSNVDIEKEILKGNIRIFPFHHDNMKGSTYNLTASKYAWSLKTKEKITSGNKIIIPPMDTGLIATKEVMWVSNKIGGSYHSKVSIVSRGGGHIGTTLDPEWIGHSVIAIHNNSYKELKLNVDETFVTIMFFYLNKPTTIEQHNNASQYGLLSELVNLTEVDRKYFDEPWKLQSKELLKKVKQDKEIISLEEQNHNPYIPSRSKLIFFSVFIVILLGSLILQTKLDEESLIYTLSQWTTGVGLSGILVPLIASFYINLK